MPKLKSVIAGLAISTGLTGGMVSMGAATTAADAATQISTGASVLASDGWGWGRHHGHHGRHHQRCNRGGHHGGGWGWGGWGHRRHHRGTVCIIVRNHNHNDNGPVHEHRRHDDDGNRW
ncbi:MULTISPECIES: hypothetical protein [unclassified Nonomuraea]|uniref:hypothetical protein n=1 Tax=unclassified Nonomuraea TaxID=2593643 RepID=UPI0035C1EAB5